MGPITPRGSEHGYPLMRDPQWSWRAHSVFVSCTDQQLCGVCEVYNYREARDEMYVGQSRGKHIYCGVWALQQCVASSHAWLCLRMLRSL
jgi:hypothetical protein